MPLRCPHRWCRRHCDGLQRLGGGVANICREPCVSRYLYRVFLVFFSCRFLFCLAFGHIVVAWYLVRLSFCLRDFEMRSVALLTICKRNNESVVSNEQLRAFPVPGTQKVWCTQLFCWSARTWCVRCAERLHLQCSGAFMFFVHRHDALSRFAFLIGGKIGEVLCLSRSNTSVGPRIVTWMLIIARSSWS